MDTQYPYADLKFYRGQIKRLKEYINNHCSCLAPGHECDSCRFLREEKEKEEKFKKETW